LQKLKFDQPSNSRIVCPGDGCAVAPPTIISVVIAPLAVLISPSSLLPHPAHAHCFAGLFFGQERGRCLREIRQFRSADPVECTVTGGQRTVMGNQPRDISIDAQYDDVEHFAKAVALRAIASNTDVEPANYPENVAGASLLLARFGQLALGLLNLSAKVVCCVGSGRAKHVQKVARTELPA
jgi:hypothetical protein